MNPSLRQTSLAVALLFGMLAGDVSAKEGGLLQPKIDASAQQQQQAPMRLQGTAEVRVLNPQLAIWQATQGYRTGSLAMQYGQYDTAAQWFQYSANMFEGAMGPCKQSAESLFAEAQMYRLLGQNAKAAPIFRMAADLFQRYDPYNPYLKASLDLAEEKPVVAPTTPPKPLRGKVTASKAVGKAQMPKLAIALPAMADSVDRNVPLKGGVAQFADGTKLAGLADDQLFRTCKALQDAVPADVSDKYIKAALTKAFMKMTCLEMAALGGNYYTAPDLYRSFKAKGKTVVIGAADEFWSPVLRLKLNGKEYGICMDLPGLAHSSKVILPVTDGEHVLAIDPRTGDCWKLMATPAKKTPDFNWWKLTHTKKT